MKLFAQTSQHHRGTESEVDDLINADLDSVSKWESC